MNDYEEPTVRHFAEICTAFYFMCIMTLTVLKWVIGFIDVNPDLRHESLKNTAFDCFLLHTLIGQVADKN